jgi:ABC-type multidrug transport system fused ATPase/permease subunit
VLQAGWLAVSASFPMIFDEYYHPGLIDLYSKQLSPFIKIQTPESIGTFGDITRLPGTLFHYLLSFPYRIITSITDSFYVSIISLRLFNVGFVIGGLIIYRKLLLEMGMSKAVSHASLSLLTLIPLFIYISANINYDNLIFLLTPAFLLYGLSILRGKNMLVINLLIFLSIGMVASLVKFSFLPVFAVAFLFVTAAVYKIGITNCVRSARKDLSKVSLATILPLILIFLVSSGLFAERYTVNLLRYGNVTVKCDEVHRLEYCAEQPVFSRNLNAKREQRKTLSLSDILVRRQKWIAN